MDGKDGRRVVVTGIGVVAPCGIGKEAFWEGLHRPAPQGEQLDRRRLRSVAVVRQPEGGPSRRPLPAVRPGRGRHGPRPTAASRTADPARQGVIIATGIGGLNTLEEQVIVRLEKGERRVSPFLVPMMMANAGAASVSMRYGWQGPCETITTACAASTHAIGYAARLIAWGRCDAVLAGGTESSITPTSMAGFRNMTAPHVERHQPALRRQARRLRDVRGRRGAAARGAGGGAGPRRPHLRRGPRRGQHRRRPPHHRAVARRHRRGGVHGAGPGRRRAAARATSARSTPTARRRR